MKVWHTTTHQHKHTWHVREEQYTLVEVVTKETVTDLGEEGQPHTEREILVS